MIIYFYGIIDDASRVGDSARASLLVFIDRRDTRPNALMATFGLAA